MKKILYACLMMSAVALQARADIAEETQDVWYEITDTVQATDGTGIISCKFKYLSVDVKGETDTLSAVMHVGKNWSNTKYKTVDSLQNIVLMEHYTITSNKECPTQTSFDINTIGIQNHLLIEPDYIGFGATVDEHQPYLNNRLTAQNSYDALVAGYRIFCDNSTAELLPGWRTFVAGASQGAASALAVQRYIEENDLTDTWRFAGSYICDGPYNPVTTFKGFREWGSISYPVGIPLVVTAMRDTYPDELGVYTDSDFYTPGYLAFQPEYDALVDAKASSTDDLNKSLFNYFGTKDKLGIDSILSAAVMDENSEVCKTFMACMEDQNILNGWTPTHKIHLYYSPEDEVVPYANNKELMEAYGDMVEAEKCALNLGHVYTCGLFLSSLSQAFPYEEPTPTGISAVERKWDTTLDIRDLQGHIVKDVVPGKLYIINGKKVMF